VKRHTGRVQSARGIPSTLAEKTEHIGNFAAKRYPISPRALPAPVARWRNLRYGGRRL